MESSREQTGSSDGGVQGGGQSQGQSHGQSQIQRQGGGAPLMVGGARKTHAKSRTGCKTCKLRKIKCDESKPSCRNCIRHSVTCDFLRLTPPSHSPQPGANPNQLNLVDLELLHTFTSSTYATLSEDPIIRDVWRLSVMPLCLQTEFLMRTVLAIAALHLAHYRKDRSEFYTNKALMHHQLATREVVSQMSNVTPENWEKIHVFSMLTIYIALGSPRPQAESHSFPLPGDSNFPEWLFLLRGIRSLSEFRPSDGYSGPLSPIFARGAESSRVMLEESQACHDKTEILQDLQRLVNEAVGAADPALLAIYNEAIRKLRGSLSLYLHRSRALDVHDAFLWLYFESQEFMPLLRDGGDGHEGPRQEAVAIFAHFCILLKRLRGNWWLQDWDTYLLGKAYQFLDQRHRLWIRWPIEELGWVPPP